MLVQDIEVGVDACGVGSGHPGETVAGVADRVKYGGLPVEPVVS
jgi:hypothetical protein